MQKKKKVSDWEGLTHNKLFNGKDWTMISMGNPGFGTMMCK